MEKSMKKATEKPVVITLRLPPTAIERLELLSKATGLKPAQAARAILQGGIDEAERELEEGSCEQTTT